MKLVSLSQQGTFTGPDMRPVKPFLDRPRSTPRLWKAATTKPFPTQGDPTWEDNHGAPQGSGQAILGIHSPHFALRNKNLQAKTPDWNHLPSPKA